MFEKKDDKNIYRADGEGASDLPSADEAKEDAGSDVLNMENEVSRPETESVPHEESPEAADINGRSPDEQKMELYEQLLMDTFGFRIKQVGKALFSAFLMMAAGIAAVWFLMTPSPGGTVLESDPKQHSRIVVDDYSGKGEFVSEELEQGFSANSDVVGWLKLDGCDIDNLVFQSVDNSYYLRKNEEGRYSVWGCYFMDFINLHSGATLFDRVTIIYGHSSGNSSEGNRFSKIKRYRDADFAREHPVFSFSLLFREMKWEVFACTDMPITINYIDPDPNDSRFRETFGYMIENSYVDFGIELKDDDQILLLSTCTSDPYTRFVLAARLVNE